jgi:hypothetical protein
MTDDVCLVSTAANRDDIICEFGGEPANQAERLIAALNPTQCQ